MGTTGVFIGSGRHPYSSMPKTLARLGISKGVSRCDYDAGCSLDVSEEFDSLMKVAGLDLMVQ